MKTIKFKINSYQDRYAIIVALANNGYKVFIEEHKEHSWDSDTDYYVVVETKGSMKGE